MNSDSTIHDPTVSDKYLNECIKHRATFGVTRHPLSEPKDCPDLFCQKGCPFNLHEEVQNEGRTKDQERDQGS